MLQDTLVVDTKCGIMLTSPGYKSSKLVIGRWVDMTGTPAEGELCARVETTA